MKLPFDADQATYDAWHAFHAARIDNAEFFMADLMDMVINFVVARKMASERPELIPKLTEVVPDHLERVRTGSTELGTFMGVSTLAKTVGFDTQRAEQLALDAVSGR